MEKLKVQFIQKRPSLEKRNDKLFYYNLKENGEVMLLEHKDCK